MVSKEKLVNGISDFMRLDLFPAMPDGITKFGSYIVMAAFRNNPDTFIEEYLPFVKMFGVTSDGNSYDIDKMAHYMREAFNEVPHLKIGGFTLDANDLNNLIGRIK